MRSIHDHERLFAECRARYGDCFTVHVVGARAGNHPLVVVCDPDVIRELFLGGPELSAVGGSRDHLRKLVGDDSLFMLEGAEHLRRRRLVLPPFKGESVKGYGNLVTEIVEREIEGWRVGATIPLGERMQAITGEVILRAVFGVDDPVRLDAIRPIIAMLSHPGLRRTPAQDCGAGHGVISAQRVIDDVVNAEIARRRRYPDAARGRDVLSLLMGARNEDATPLTDRQLRDELVTLLWAGQDTTSAGLAWAFEHLLRDQAALDRATEDALAGDGRYVDAVIAEALRLSPPIPLVNRTLLRSWQVNGVELPAGTDVGVSIYLVHRREDLYPDPDSFRPERFLDAGLGTYTWLAFAGGVRRCVGASLAQLEMRIVLREVLARVSLELAEPGPLPAARWRRVVRAPATGTPAVVRGKLRPGGSAGAVMPTCPHATRAA